MLHLFWQLVTPYMLENAQEETPIHVMQSHSFLQHHHCMHYDTAKHCQKCMPLMQILKCNAKITPKTHTWCSLPGTVFNLLPGLY